MSLFKSLIIMTLFIIPAINAQAQESNHQHQKHLSKLLDHYMAAKDALIEDDFETAQSSLSEFQKEASENEEMNHHEEHAKTHQEHHAAMKKALKKAEAAEDIDNLRAAFSDISDHLAKATENLGYDEETLYLKYCPMANNNEGALWLSEQEQIKNPYMAKTMSG
ncbi:MAG: DUF3347 domain-containing protein, partial [Balneolales bacterium]